MEMTHSIEHDAAFPVPRDMKLRAAGRHRYVIASRITQCAVDYRNASSHNHVLFGHTTRYVVLSILLQPIIAAIPARICYAMDPGCGIALWRK
jgi:hypothetical protein